MRKPTAPTKKPKPSWLAGMIPIAIVAGLLLGIGLVALGATVLKPQALKSYEYWTAQATPWRIANQYSMTGEHMQVIEIENVGGRALYFQELDLSGTLGDTQMGLRTPSRFEPNEAKTLMIRTPQTCRTNQSYEYRLVLRYSEESGGEVLTQEGAYPVYGICE